MQFSIFREMLSIQLDSFKQDMLTTAEDEKFGTITVKNHFDRIAKEGQDPFTPVRATGLISKAMDLRPLALVSIPLGFGFMTRPGWLLALPNRACLCLLGYQIVLCTAKLS